MATIQTDAVRPVEGFPRPSKDLDIEKNHAHEVDSNAETKSVESEQFQSGVQRVRAITDTWDKKTLILMFCCLFTIEFVAFLQNSIDASLNPWVVSFFSRHGLLNVANIMSTAVAGSLPLVVSKIIDIWGRVEGFLFMLTVVVVGMALKAAAQNMETYVAGNVLYWAGHIGVLYVTDVMSADCTTLKNRMIIFTINGTPRIAGTFAGPKIAEIFLTKHSWRWFYGAFIITFVCCCIPALLIMTVMFHKAKKNGDIIIRRSDRTLMQSIAYYFVQFDITGILLIVCAFSIFMLPFSLSSYAPNGWSTGYIIAMIVIGFLLFPAFAFWEAKLAPVQFMPWKYLRDPTILGSCMLYGVMFLSIFVWNAYFQSYLLVVHRQSVVHAGYILNSFSLTSSIFSPLIAWWISYSGNFKWTAYTGVPIVLLGTALLIPFRAPNTNPGVLAFTQVLVGLGTGFFATCGQLAVMVPVTHQQIAAIMAIWGLFGSFGSSIGFAIAGALWNNLLPRELLRRLPESSKPDYFAIYGDITKQLEFADGTPEREAIVGAYSYTMRVMVIIGACLMPLCLLSIYFWKNINIKKLEEEKGKQTKGTVF